MLNVATGTGLYALQQRELPSRALRNAANDNGDEEDQEQEEDDTAPPPMLGGFPLPPGFDINKIVSQVASDVVTKLIEKFSGKMPSFGAILDPRKAYAEGQREREAQAAAQRAATIVAPAALATTARTAQPKEPTQPAASSVPTDAASMAHFLAVKNALTRDEQALVVALAQELTDEDRAAWFSQLRALSVQEAAATVRATLAQLVSQRQPTSSLTSSQTERPVQADSSSPPVATQATQGESRAS